MITSIITNEQKVCTVQIKYNGNYVVENQNFKSKTGLPVRAIFKAYKRIFLMSIKQKLEVSG
jgi:hypothetical protein